MRYLKFGSSLLLLACLSGCYVAPSPYVAAPPPAPYYAPPPIMLRRSIILRQWLSGVVGIGIATRFSI